MDCGLNSTGTARNITSPYGRLHKSGKKLPSAFVRFCTQWASYPTRHLLQTSATRVRWNIYYPFIYFRQGRYAMPSVCLSVCLSVCRLANLRKNY